MNTAKGENYLQAKLEELENIDEEKNGDVEAGLSKFAPEDNDVSKADIGRKIIMDAEGNYYYQTLESTVKIERLTVKQVKKVAAIMPSLSSCKRKSPAQVPESLKKPKLEISECKIRKSEENTAESVVDETIVSEIENQEKMYEFNENEDDSDDPQNVTGPDYVSKGIVKETKNSTAIQPASFTCPMCPYQTDKKSSLSRHLKKHSTERRFKCDVCERGFKTNSALSNHRNIHLGRKPHACPNCDMAFTTSGELVRHERYRHTHIKPHKCTECDYSSVEMSKLRRHMRCHTGERPYQCPHCTYASPDTFKLKRHMRTHTGEKPYECDICYARFTQSNSLKHHRLIHSVNEKPVFQCNLCPATCGRKTDLRLHIKNLHSSDQPYPCKRCGKELPDRYTYKMHIKTHEGEKCFHCQYCPYASITQRHLESHTLIHLDEKPFVCDICQASFRQKQLLTRHMKIYHLDSYAPPKQHKKDHKCPHCNKMFAFKGNLIRHMEIHDPTSRRSEEKDLLKRGRRNRVQPDGTVITVQPSSRFSRIFNNNELLYNDETEKEQQIVDEDLQEVEYDEVEEYNDDNMQYVYDEYEADEYEEQYDEKQYEGQLEETNENTLLIDVKQEKVQTMYVEPATLKNNITPKSEDKQDSKIMVLEEPDDQFMVIEVLPDDEDNDDQQQEEQKEIQVQFQETKPTILTIKTNSSSLENRKDSESLISDYFGFEVNEDEGDEETKGAIKMLEMIEQE